MEFTSRDEAEESAIRKGHPTLYSIQHRVLPKENPSNVSLGCLTGIESNVPTNELVNLKCCADVEQRSRDLQTTLGGR